MFCNIFPIYTSEKCNFLIKTVAVKITQLQSRMNEVFFIARLSPNRSICPPYFLSSIQKREWTNENNVVNCIYGVFSRENHVITSMSLMFYARACVYGEKIRRKKKRKNDET